jgi:hypothetical protein
VKKLLLATAALLAASTAVHADTALPDTMHGGWCPIDNNDTLYARDSEQAQHDPLCRNIERKGYWADEVDCTFTKVDRITPDAFLVQSRCTVLNMRSRSYKTVYQLIGDGLLITNVDVLPSNIAHWYTLNEICRSGTDMDEVCVARDKLSEKLVAQGYCIYGHGVIGVYSKDKSHCYERKSLWPKD